MIDYYMWTKWSNVHCIYGEKTFFVGIYQSWETFESERYTSGVMTTHNTGNHSNTTLYLYLDVTPKFKTKKQKNTCLIFFFENSRRNLRSIPKTKIYTSHPPQKKTSPFTGTKLRPPKISSTASFSLSFVAVPICSFEHWNKSWQGLTPHVLTLTSV